MWRRVCRAVLAAPADLRSLAFGALSLSCQPAPVPVAPTKLDAPKVQVARALEQAPVLAVTLPPRVAQCSAEFGSPNRRLTRFELAYAIEDVFGVDATRLQGLPAPARSIGDVPDIVVGQQLDTGEGFLRPYTEYVSQLAAQAAPSIAARCRPAREKEACVLGALREPLTLLYRGEPRDDSSPEVEALRVAIASGAKTPNAMAEAGIRHLLLSPRFYIAELQRSEQASQADEHRLLATRLALVLWSSVPDLTLLRRAADGVLDDPAQLQSEIVRLQSDPKFTRFATEFTRQWLRLDRPAQFRPSWEQRGLIADPTRFAKGLEHSASLLRRNHEQGLPLTRLLDAEQGLLTSPAITTALSSPINGGGDENWLGRGLVVQSALLCRSFPLAAVYPSEKWEHHALLNPKRDEHSPRPGEPELLRIRTHDEPCAQCHTQLETIGAALAEFNGLGERTPEADVARAFSNLGRIAGDSVHGPAALGHWIEASGRFEPCVAQKLATYVLSRAVLPARRNADRCLVAALTQNEQPSLATLLDELLHSPEFRRPGTIVVRERPTPIPNSVTYRQPSVTPPPATAQCNGFEPAAFMQAQCGTSACHAPGSANGGFAFGNEELVRRALRGMRPNARGHCGQYASYLDPREPARSLIVRKLLGGDVCGAPMPITGGPESLGAVESRCLLEWFERVARE